MHLRMGVPPPNAAAVCISAPDGRLVVELRYDGSVHFGPGITPDAAAREFYERLAGLIVQGRP